MFQETWNETQIIMILLIPTSSSSRDTKLAHADTVLFLPFCALFKETFHWFKQCLKVGKKKTETEKEKATCVQSEKCNTCQSRKDIRSFLHFLRF